MKFIDSNTIVVLNRKYLFRDAFTGIMSKSPQELKKRLRIVYKNEDGVDAGGLLRYFLI